MLFSRYLVLAIVAILVTIGVARLGGDPFGHEYKFVVNFFFPFLIIYCSKYFSKKVLYYIIVLLPSLVISFIIFNYNINWKFYELATPSSASFFIGLITAILFFKSKKHITKTSILIIAVFFNLFVFFMGYDYWLHKLNFQTFFGEQNISLTGEKYFNNTQFASKFMNKDTTVLSFINADSVKLNLNEKNTLYLLNFWNNTCGHCIKEFPSLQKLYNKKLNDSSKFKMFLINVPDSNNDILLAKDIVTKRNISVPLLFFNGTEDERERKFHVFSYPTALMIRNNTIIHIGNFYSAQKRLAELLDE